MNKDTLEYKYLVFLNEVIDKINLSIMLEDNSYLNELKNEAFNLIKLTNNKIEINKLKENNIEKVKVSLIIKDKDDVFLKNNQLLEGFLSKNQDIFDLIKNILLKNKILKEENLNVFSFNLLGISNDTIYLNIYYQINDFTNLDLSNLNKINIKDLKINNDIKQKIS